MGEGKSREEEIGMWYDGTVRIIEERPFFGCDVDGPMEMGLFSDGFHFGCFVNGEFLSLGRAILENAGLDELTGELRMEWMRVKDTSTVRGEP